MTHTFSKMKGDECTVTTNRKTETSVVLGPTDRLCFLWVCCHTQQRDINLFIRWEVICGSSFDQLHEKCRHFTWVTIRMSCAAVLPLIFLFSPVWPTSFSCRYSSSVGSNYQRQGQSWNAHMQEETKKSAFTHVKYKTNPPQRPSQPVTQGHMYIWITHTHIRAVDVDFILSKTVVYGGDSLHL